MRRALFRVLTVVDRFTRECLLLLADSSLTGQKVASALSRVIAERGALVSITVDNGTSSRARRWTSGRYQYQVHLDFIRPGRAVENGYIESFNGRVRDECLNLHVFFTLADVREKLERWRKDYNQVRPHSALLTAARKSSRRAGCGDQPSRAPLRQPKTRRRARCDALRPRIQNPDSFPPVLSD